MRNIPLCRLKSLEVGLNAGALLIFLPYSLYFIPFHSMRYILIELLLYGRDDGLTVFVTTVLALKKLTDQVGMAQTRNHSVLRQIGSVL